MVIAAMSRITTAEMVKMSIFRELAIIIQRTLCKERVDTVNLNNNMQLLHSLLDKRVSADASSANDPLAPFRSLIEAHKYLYTDTEIKE